MYYKATESKKIGEQSTRQENIPTAPNSTPTHNEAIKILNTAKLNMNLYFFCYILPDLSDSALL